MASFDYANAAATAKALIEKFGAAGQFIILGQKGGYDDFGNETPDTPDTPIDGTVTPLLQYKTREIDGINILAGDSFVFFDSATDVEIGNQITINGDLLRAVNVYRLSSADSIRVFQKIQLRK